MNPCKCQDPATRALGLEIKAVLDGLRVGERAVIEFPETSPMPNGRFEIRSTSPRSCHGSKRPGSASCACPTCQRAERAELKLGKLRKLYWSLVDRTLEGRE